MSPKDPRTRAKLARPAARYPLSGIRLGGRWRSSNATRSRSAPPRSSICSGCRRISAARSRSTPSARTAIQASPSAATSCASSNTSSPTRSPPMRRHAGLDRRRAVQPHPHGRGGRGQDRHEVPPGAGKLGAAEDAVYDRVGNILISRVMGADVQLVDEGFDIGIRQSWERRHCGCQGTRAASPMRSRPAPRCTNTAGSAMSASPRRCGSRRRARLHLRLHRGLHGHRLDPCRHAGGLRQGRARAQGDRHRRFLDAGQTKAQVLDIARGYRRSRRIRPRDRRGRCRPDRGLRLSGLWRSL